MGCGPMACQHRAPHAWCHGAAAGFGPRLMRSIEKIGFERPTAIQAQALPVVLSGRDVIGVAKTGSGKTMAFVWPMLVHIKDQVRACARNEDHGAFMRSPVLCSVHLAAPQRSGRFVRVTGL